MATHPHKPKDPKAPKRNRHTVAAETREVKHDPRGEAVLVERDTQRVLAWLSESPLRTLTSDALRQWMAAQEPPWTPGYCRTIKERVTAYLSDATAASLPQITARLLHLIDGLIPQCRTYRTGSGGEGFGTVVLRDPVSGDYLYEIEHSAVLGYMRLYGELTGALRKDHKHLHLHANRPDAIASMTDDELRAIEAEAEVRDHADG